jgi:glycosyltransferase involved in cell wall biosynthesis
MSDSSPTRLAIVIPAYKTKFLREALQSIANQTDKRFQLYVGDDCSPEPVDEIVRKFSQKLPIKYHRFENNLGKISLVQQWERCIRISHEPWVWIFSDDDFMDETCVAAFYNELKNTEGNHDAYRFNSVFVNSIKNIVTEKPPHPQNETGVEFLLARLRGENTSNMQELIFSRRAWEDTGGIPDFPLGWAADDALIATLGLHKPICTISGPCVNWRWSGVNISNDWMPFATRSKLKASRLFAEWAADFFANKVPVDKKPSRSELNKIIEDWFFRYITFAWEFLDWRTCLENDRMAARMWNRKRGCGFFRSVCFNCVLICTKLARK